MTGHFYNLDLVFEVLIAREEKAYDWLNIRLVLKNFSRLSNELSKAYILQVSLKVSLVVAYPIT